MSSVNKYEVAACIVSLILGLITLAAASYTLYQIRKYKSMSYLQNLTLIILVISLIQSVGALLGTYHCYHERNKILIISTCVGHVI